MIIITTAIIEAATISASISAATPAFAKSTGFGTMRFESYYYRIERYENVCKGIVGSKFESYYL
jgi:hypothetical protein